jgi:hypothetical protein
MRTTRPASLILLDLVTLIIFSEVYKLRSFSLRTLLPLPPSYVLIFCLAPCSQTSKSTVSLSVRDQVSHPYHIILLQHYSASQHRRPRLEIFTAVRTSKSRKSFGTAINLWNVALYESINKWNLVSWVNRTERVVIIISRKIVFLLSTPLQIRILHKTKIVISFVWVWSVVSYSEVKVKLSLCFTKHHAMKT